MNQKPIQNSVSNKIFRENNNNINSLKKTTNSNTDFQINESL